jgi:PleD family two-component response regulator
VPGAVVNLTVSIGTAISRGPVGADRLVAASDAALYRAKASGRNRVEAATAADWSAVTG